MWVSLVFDPSDKFPKYLRTSILQLLGLFLPRTLVMKWICNQPVDNIRSDKATGKIYLRIKNPYLLKIGARLFSTCYPSEIMKFQHVFEDLL
jgi:hypothetical protein